MSKPKPTEPIAEFLPGTQVMVDLVSPIGSPSAEHAVPGTVKEHFKYAAKDLAGMLSNQCSVQITGATRVVSTGRFL